MRGSIRPAGEPAPGSYVCKRCGIVRTWKAHRATKRPTMCVDCRDVDTPDWRRAAAKGAAA